MFQNLTLLSLFFYFFVFFAANVFVATLVTKNNQTKEYQLQNEFENVSKSRRLKILVYPWTIFYSHVQFQLAIADALAEAGHEVHLLIIDTKMPWLGPELAKRRHMKIVLLEPHAKDLRNMLFIDVKKIWNPFGGNNFGTLASNTAQFEMLHERLQATCKFILSNRNLLDELRAERYDAAISEPYDECMFGVFYAIKVRSRCCASIATGRLGWVAYKFGLPIIHSYVPDYVTPSANAPFFSVFERVLNLYNNVYESLYMHEATLRVEPMFRELIDPQFPPLDEIARNVSLLFVNSNEFIDLPRPLSNKIIHIGGIGHEEGPETKTIKNLAVKRFLDEADAGAVLVSFGTVTNQQEMPETLKRSMLGAFSRFPRVRFLWKYNRNESDFWENALFATTTNVRTVTWVEQKAVLKHPRLRAFLTHCGQNSVFEAARNGVPLIALPLFGDQLLNAAKLRHKGAAFVVDLNDLLFETGHGVEVLSAAIHQVLNNPDYREQAKLLQQKLVFAPFSSRERLVRWVEFAAQFGDLAELNLPRPQDVGGFLPYHSLDIIGALLAIFLLLAWIAFVLSKKLMNAAIFLVFEAVKAQKIFQVHNDHSILNKVNGIIDIKPSKQFSQTKSKKQKIL